MRMKDVTILQISPANGFSAVFADEDATVYTRPVACWSLVKRILILNDSEWERIERMVDPQDLEEERQKKIPVTRIEGMVSGGKGELVACEDDDYFLGYIGPGESPFDYQEKARDLIDSFDRDEDDEEDSLGDDYLSDADITRINDALPQTLSHLSVTIQEQIRKGKVPRKWEEGGWLEFMRHFGDLSGG